jgi:phosphoribosylamine--glycine ligase
VKVLLVGGGGREHALAWKLRQDDPAIELVAAPGNPGISTLARCLPVASTDIDRLAELAEQEQVSFTLVGPEAPLASGIVDRFRARGLPIFGPTRAAAEIESSKAFAKQVMSEAGVPTARAALHTESAPAKRAARNFGAPVVIKASGLAAGKGVIVCETIEDADAAIDLMLRDRVFGAAGAEVLVEEFMQGEELSLFALTDGWNVLPFPPAQDHKRLLDGDRGPNTGGMGAYAPASAGRAEFVAQGASGSASTGVAAVADTILLPTLEAMRARGRAFTGLLYAGLMLTADGPKVVEFNCRYGDPETEALLPLLRVQPSLLELTQLIATGGRLPASATVTATGHAVTTVLAAAGYPDHPRAGDRIALPAVEHDGVHIFHAGTRLDAESHLVTAGGRVLAITAVSGRLDEAQRLSAHYADRTEFSGKQYRSDIGGRELARRAGAP